MQQVERHPLGRLRSATPIFALIAFALVINAQGDRYLRGEVERNLVSIIEVISSGITTELHQAMLDADVNAARPEVIEAAGQLLQSPGDQAALLRSPAQQTLRQHFATLMTHDLYAGFVLIGPDDRVLAASHDAILAGPGLRAAGTQLLATAWSGKTLMSPLIESEVPLPNMHGAVRDRAPTAFAISAVRDDDGQIIALLALRLNPDHSVYRMLRVGMTGRTGESYLFDHSGIMLSGSRFTADLRSSGRLASDEPTFAHLRLHPPDEHRLTRMAEAATQGRDGVDVDGYPDYRGVNVVGAWRWMEEFGMGVAVEVDADEVFAGKRLLQGALLGITTVAALLIGLLGWHAKGRRRELEALVAARTSELDTERAKLSKLFEQAPNSLVIADAAGSITAFSDCARRTFGYDAAEVLGRSMDSLFTERLPYLMRDGDTAHLEVDGRRRDGTLVPLQVSLRMTRTAAGSFLLGVARDMTEARQMEQEMRDEVRRRREAETRQRLLLEAAGEGILWLDPDGRISYINPTGESLLGYRDGELAGRHLTEASTDSPPISDGDSPLVASNRSNRVVGECLLRRADGLLIETQFTRAPLLSEDGTLGSVVVFSDITARKASEHAMLLAENVFQHINEGILVTDVQGYILRVNRALCSMVGYSEAELLGQRRPPFRSGEHPPIFYRQMWDSLLTSGHWEGEIWNRRKDGDVFPTWQTITAIDAGSDRPQQFVSVTRDITDQRRAEQHIHRLAYFDNLTELPNRELFFDRFEHAIERAQRQQGKIALLFLDLDRFKNVNDSLGHPVGDQLLRAVAGRLRELVRSEDTIARLGGDEFTVLLESASNHETVIQVAEKVVDALSEPFDIGDHQLHIGTSVGISVYPEDGYDAVTLVKNADAAMYQAKAAGRSNFQFYSSSMSSRTAQTVALEAALYRAVAQGEFLLHYQPLFDRDGEMVGVEALVRWQNPVIGMIPPGEFIPLAEQNGLIIRIGEWVLRNACRQMMEWRAQGDVPPLWLSVNVAGPQITRGNIVQTVTTVLAETGFPAELLELEVTETFVMDNTDQAVTVLSSLRKLGVKIAIDDFGTGHSSLATLKRLPLDTLKIDRAFVSDIPNDANDVAITRAILAMGRQLKLSTVAEGVETPAQKAFLVREGCDHFQGYLFSRPLPAESLQLLWQGRRQPRSRTH